MAQSTFDVCVKESMVASSKKKSKKKTFANFYIAWSITVKQSAERCNLIGVWWESCSTLAENTHKLS